jgi:hypothetical protein
MSYAIVQDIIPGLPRDPFRKGIGAYEGVVDHSTATPEATDEAESRYFHREWKNRKAFPHFAVDWDSVTQLADINYQAWGAGNGNPRYLHVELCETRDHNKFLESYKRYTWLTAELLRRKNLGATDNGTVVSHAWVSKYLGGTDHVDPIGYLASHGVSWPQHIANVRAVYDSFFTKPTPAPQPNGLLGVDSVVTIKGTATHYATGELIASFVRNSKYKVIQVRDEVKSYSRRSYLLSGIMSWVLEQDIVESGVGNGTPLPPAPPAPPAPSGPKSIGSIRIVGVSNSAIVMDRPNRNDCNNIGTVTKGAVISISGSVRGVNSDTGYWKVIYNGKVGYITGKYGAKQ